MKIITRNASLYNNNGLLVRHDVTITEDGHLIYIDDYPHHKKDLVIEETRLESAHFDTPSWYLDWS